MTRCSLVSKRFRETIEDLEEDHPEHVRSTQRARIFVCDRRRAILEGVSSFTPTRFVRESEKELSRNSSKETLSPRERKKSRTKSTSNSESSENNDKEKKEPAIPFISDQYADNSLPNWAFQFNFDEWIANYEVEEVFFKNFCSFFDREKSSSEMNMRGSPALGTPRAPSPPDSCRMLSPPPSTSKCGVAINDESMYTRLLPKDIEGLKRLSAGRVERLAKNLEHIRNAHFVFKDFCCYNGRPPALIFWFLSMVRRSMTHLTFDRVQATVPVELHDVLTLANVRRVTVIQPDSKPGIMVRAQFLLMWLRLPDQIRQKISVHLTGCREMTPKGLAAFVTAWKVRPEPAVFNQISIDANSYKFNEFINELESLQSKDDLIPPKSPFSKPYSDENAHDVVLEKSVEIFHSKDATFSLRFRYCKPSRRMVLTCECDDLPSLKALSPVPTFSRLSLSRPHSSASVLTELRNVQSASVISLDPKNRLLRPVSQNGVRIAGCRENGHEEEPSFVNRMLRFLASSS
ncbi:unnamed protein product [Caenorhabditis bovis]|uniref:Uncharacterized protein n=1 Tax=Caenorhabditis bovis TaxID=2654633 RepID=A0A8S1E6B3_9PELO|nr:unnamed protein product [Caenorhabditis bovis]